MTEPGRPRPTPPPSLPERDGRPPAEGRADRFAASHSAAGGERGPRPTTRRTSPSCGSGTIATHRSWRAAATRHQRAGLHAPPQHGAANHRRAAAAAARLRRPFLVGGGAQMRPGRSPAHLNSSFIGPPEKPKIRLTAARRPKDISAPHRMIVAMKQRKPPLRATSIHHLARWINGRARGGAGLHDRAACGALSRTPNLGFDAERAREVDGHGITRGQVPSSGRTTPASMLFESSGDPSRPTEELAVLRESNKRQRSQQRVKSLTRRRESTPAECLDAIVAWMTPCAGHDK